MFHTIQEQYLLGQTFTKQIFSFNAFRDDIQIASMLIHLPAKLLAAAAADFVTGFGSSVASSDMGKWTVSWFPDLHFKWKNQAQGPPALLLSSLNLNGILDYLECSQWQEEHMVIPSAVCIMYLYLFTTQLNVSLIHHWRLKFLEGLWSWRHSWSVSVNESFFREFKSNLECCRSWQDGWNMLKQR